VTCALYYINICSLHNEKITFDSHLLVLSHGVSTFLDTWIFLTKSKVYFTALLTCSFVLLILLFFTSYH